MSQEICLYLTLNQRYNYTIYFYSQQHPPRDEIISVIAKGMRTTEIINNEILETLHPRVLIGIGTEYADYNFQVFIPTMKARKTGSIRGLFLPFDGPTWAAFCVTMVTTSGLFWIILCPEEGERMKSLAKRICWLLLTLFEQSVEPLKSKSKKMNWLVTMGT